MADLSTAIKSFISDEIKLSRVDTSKAANSRKWFLQRIENEISRRANQPSLYSDSFVHFGSYFKGTKVAVTDEFDILVVIDSNTGFFSRQGNTYGTGQGTADPNYKYNSKYIKSDGDGVSPSKLLNWLQDVVETVVSKFNGEAPVRDGQAITAKISSKNLSIDLVPAGIFKRKSDGSIFYNIPNGKKDNSWTLTAPREDIDLLNSVAAGKDNFRNIIRLCKYIRTAYNFLVPSFAIESGIVQYAQKYKWNDDLYIDLYYSLVYLSKTFRDGNILAPYDSSNLLANIDSLDWYADRIDGIMDSMKKLKSEQDQSKLNEKISKLFQNN